MLLRDLPQALLRRWYLLALGLGIAVAATWMVWTQVGPSYLSRSSTLLLPPISVTEPVPPETDAGNPLLYLESLGQPRDALISAILADGMVESLEERFPDTTFAIEPDRSANAPIIVATAEGPTEEGAITAATDTSERIQAEVLQIQDSLEIVPDQQIRSVSLTKIATATPRTQNATRVAVVLAGGTLLLTVLLIGLIDGLIAKRATRRRGSTGRRDPVDERGTQPEPRVGRRAIPADNAPKPSEGAKLPSVRGTIPSPDTISPPSRRN